MIVVGEALGGRVGSSVGILLGLFVLLPEGLQLGIDVDGNEVGSSLLLLGLLEGISLGRPEGGTVWIGPDGASTMESSHTVMLSPVTLDTATAISSVASLAMESTCLSSRKASEDLSWRRITT